MTRPGLRKSIRAPALLKKPRPEKSPSPEPFTVPTYSSSAITEYTIPNFSTKTKPPLTSYASSSTPTLTPAPSNPTIKPLNALTSAMHNRKTIQEKHQEALAKKRKREMESQEGYRCLENNLQKYVYTGGDPRVDWDAIRGEIGQAERESEGSGGEGSGMQVGVSSNERRDIARREPQDGRVELRGKDQNAVVEIAEKRKEGSRTEKARGTSVVESSGRRPPPEPPVVVPSLDVDVSMEEEDDEQFNKILASKTRSSKRSHRILSPTIKPFRPITKRVETPLQAQHVNKHPSKSTYNAQPRLPATKISSFTSHYAKRGEQGSNKVPSDEGEAAKRRRAAMARAAAMMPGKDDYGDDDFDKLLGSATVFDDGTDVYADEGFDNLLAQALANGQNFA